MRESRASGFVRGAHSDMRPYRDLYLAVRYALLGMWPKVGFSDNCAERGVSTASLLRQVFRPLELEHKETSGVHRLRSRSLM